MPLVGRAEECARIDAAVAERMSLAIRGEAGIGKTALLEYAREAAGDGVRTLFARGLEGESELPYAGLLTLLGPVIDAAGELPERQRAALEGALAIGPPSPADRLVVSAATLSLIAAAAERDPLLLLVDDLHWLDAASAEALLFAARRIERERAAVIATVRDGENGHLDLRGIPELPVPGLDGAAAEELLRREARRPPAAAVVERILAVAGGNPLALTEIPNMLSDSELDGSRPLDEPVAVGPGIESAFQRRLATLPEEARRAVLLAATGPEAVERIARACEEAGCAAADLGAAEDAGLLGIRDGQVRFVHPLARAAVYHGARPSERREAHRAMAASEPEGPARAWHLAAAATGPDEEAASALEAAAEEARLRTGYGLAAEALERAARLTPEGGERVRRLIAAAADRFVAGSADRAEELLADAIQGAEDPRVRALARQQLARVELVRGSLDASHASAIAAAEELHELDRELGALALIEAGLPCFMAGRIPLAVEIQRRAHEWAREVGGGCEALAALAHSGALTIAGLGDRDEIEAALGRWRESLGYAMSVGSPVALGIVEFLTWWERYDEAVEASDMMIVGARDAGAISLVQLQLATRAELDFRIGNWSEARARGAESVRLAEETGHENQTAFAVLNVAHVEAALGLEDDARARVKRGLAEASRSGMASMPVYASTVLGLLDLGAGRAAEAAEHLDEAERLCEQFGMRDPSVVQWRTLHVEALLRSGRREDAERSLAVLEEQAQRVRRPALSGAAGRCSALLAPDEEIDERFAEALRLQARGQEPFERARTRLAYGERLRRAGRRSDAREPLHGALEEFDRLGAEPWSRRARSELRASGAAVAPAQPALAGTLTPQELEVVMQVAHGATNREAAAALYLSPKTVEAHLGRVYRKLGIRSRSELALAVVSGGLGGGEAGHQH